MRRTVELPLKVTSRHKSKSESEVNSIKYRWGRSFRNQTTKLKDYCPFPRSRSPPKRGSSSRSSPGSSHSALGRGSSSYSLFNVKEETNSEGKNISFFKLVFIRSMAKRHFKLFRFEEYQPFYACGDKNTIRANVNTPATAKLAIAE